MLTRPRKEGGRCWCAGPWEGKGRTCPAVRGDHSHPGPSQRAKVEEREPGGRSSHASTEADSPARRDAPARRAAPACCRDHGPVLLSLATLTIPQSWPRAQADGEALVGHQPTEAAVPAPAWEGLGSRCQHAALAAPGSPAAWGAGTDPEATSGKATCFPSGRRALAASLMSQMERAAQESPEPTGCLPAAPLQPKWKNIWPQRSARLLRPRAPAGPPPGPADTETLTLAFFGQISLGGRQRRLRHPWPRGSAHR